MRQTKALDYFGSQVIKDIKDIKFDLLAKFKHWYR